MADRSLSWKLIIWSAYQLDRSHGRRARTQSCRYIGDALLIGHTVETKDAVDFWEGSSIHVRGPLDSPLTTEVGIVKRELDELNMV